MNTVDLRPGNRWAANQLWGEEAVEAAMGEPKPEPITRALALAVRLNADPPSSFRAWALSQPWPRFCAIVRLVCGLTTVELLKELHDGRSDQKCSLPAA